MSIEDKRSQLKALLNKAPTAPVQKVNPVQGKSKHHINFHISQDLAHKIKLYALQHNMTIKQVGILAFEKFLNEMDME